MVASSISDPTVRNTSRGGMQPNIESVSQSGVETFWLKSIGVGRSTRTPRPSRILANPSSSSLALSTVSCGRGPHCPRISESSGTFASSAGSGGAIQHPSATPTITCFSGLHSFHELTLVFAMLNRNSPYTILNYTDALGPGPLRKVTTQRYETDIR